MLFIKYFNVYCVGSYGSSDVYSCGIAQMGNCQIMPSNTYVGRGIYS